MADSSAPIQQIVAGANAAVNINENFDAASPALLFGRNAATTTGLTWGYCGGWFRSIFVSSGTVALSNNSTNYVVAANATGVVTASTSTTNWNNELDYTKLYELPTSGGAVVTAGIRDRRQAINSAAAASVGLPGYSFTIDTSSTTDADPGNGNLRFNNATQASATVLFVDNQTADAVSLTTLYASLPQTGFITLSSATDPAKWRVFKITAVVSATGYYKFTVVSQAGNAAFANGDSVRVLIDADANTGGTVSVEMRGLTFTSDTSSTADTDPGNGLFKWNNATQASATTLFVDNQTADAVVSTTFFSKLDPGGYFYIQQTDDTTRWQQWRITGLPVAASGYYKFPVTLMAKGTDIQTGKVCACMLTPGVCETWAFACSDYKTTALTATTDVGGMLAPYAATVFDVSAGLAVAQTSGSTFTVDVNEAGTTILSTKLTFDNTEKTTVTAATPPVISDSSIAAGAVINADVDAIGDGTAKGLSIYLRVFRT